MAIIQKPNDEMGALCRALHAYWNDIRGDRNMPSRADFEPLDIRRLLPYVFLVDVKDEPLDFFYRIIGETIIQFSRHNVMGKWASGIDHHRRPSKIWTVLQETTLTGKPQHVDVPYLGPEISTTRVPVICLPFSEDGEKVNKIVGLADYEDCRRKLAQKRKPGHASYPYYPGRGARADLAKQSNPANYTAQHTGVF